MAATSVTPTAGTNAQVFTGGQAVAAAPAGPNGGLIYNPTTAAEQGVANAEPLYVDPVGTCGATSSGGTIFRLEPGQTWRLIPGQTTPTYVNAATGGHNFSVVTW